MQDIQTAVENFFVYTKDMTYERFANDAKTNDAVIRNLEMRGEAVSKLPDSFVETQSQVDWFAIKGMSNGIVRDYRNVNLITV